MGLVYEEITLKNATDLGYVSRGDAKEADVRRTTVRALVDTGAATLVINEDMQKELGLRTVQQGKSSLANGDIISCTIAEAVEVCWKDRSMVCRPWVVSGADEVLLGAIPLENMDLIVDPKNGKLIGAHGDKAIGRICNIKM
jgi:clan AA aspartic protease